MAEPSVPAPERARRIRVLAARDVLVAVAAAALLVLDARLRASAQGGVLPLVVAVLAGALLTLSGFYAHEWGHFLAARWAGATPTPAASPLSVFLFEIGEHECTREQWLWMSAGGYGASIVGLAVILGIIDLSVTSGRVAAILTSLGVLATFVLEIPITMRVYRTRR
ncbi:MAG: hypothetical protein U0234_02685 [Sandaracinus sp.]